MPLICTDGRTGGGATGNTLITAHSGRPTKTLRPIVLQSSSDMRESTLWTSSGQRILLRSRVLSKFSSLNSISILRLPFFIFGYLWPHPPCSLSHTVTFSAIFNSVRNRFFGLLIFMSFSLSSLNLVSVPLSISLLQLKHTQRRNLTM